MASSIEGLPSELLYKICEYLGPGSHGVIRRRSMDIPSFRLTCGTFAVIGRKALMQTIHFVTTEESLSRLKSISESPKLAPLVRTLVWEVHRLYHYGSMEEWARHTQNVDEGVVKLDGSMAHSAPKLLVQDAWDRYSKIHSFQQLSHESSLEVILPGFTNLDSLHFRSESYREWHGPSCQNHYGKTMLAPSWNDFDVDYGASEFDGLLNAAVITQKPLKQIQSEHLSYTFFQACSMNKYQSRPQMLADSLGRLTKLRLVICLDEGTIMEDNNDFFSDIEETCGATIAKAGLSKFLEEVPSLTSLDLQFKHIAISHYIGDDEQIPPAGLHLEDVLSSNRWSSLRALSLSWFRTDSKSLIRLLDNHASTLESVCLGKVHLHDSNWATMFDSIQSLKIDELRFVDWFSSSWPQEIFHVDVMIRKNEGFKFATRGLAFGTVQLWTSHTLSRLLTGHDSHEYEQDDEITACVDYWLRGDGRRRLETYWLAGEAKLWATAEDGAWIEQVNHGHFKIDSRKQNVNQGQGTSLRFGEFIQNTEWKQDYGIE